MSTLPGPGAFCRLKTPQALFRQRSEGQPCRANPCPFSWDRGRAGQRMSGLSLAAMPVPRSGYDCVPWSFRQRTDPILGICVEGAACYTRIHGVVAGPTMHTAHFDTGRTGAPESSLRNAPCPSAAKGARRKGRCPATRWSGFPVCWLP